MKWTIYMMMWLLFSCAAKRKLTESTVNEMQKVTKSQILQSQKNNAQSYQFHIDSVNRSHWLKVYPRDVFVINKDGFQGLADSLIWYGNSQQIGKSQKVEKQTQERLSLDIASKTEVETYKTQKSQLIKTVTSLWLIIALVVVCLLVFLYRKLNGG